MLKNARPLSAGVFLLALAGCALQPPNPQEARILSRPLLCEGEERCNEMWRRAQTWIANNSRYKLQTVTDVVISTYGPIGTQAYFAYQVTRERAYGKTDELRLKLLCPNLFGCGNRAEETSRFQSYVEQK